MSTSKRAIMHIPHTEMLSLKPIAEWAKSFRSDQFARTSPTEIVLPAVGLGGPSFQSDVHPYPSYLKPRVTTRSGAASSSFDLLPDWIQQCRELSDTVKVWAFVNPVYAFLDGEHTRLLDQHGITLDDNMCITNSVVQKMTDVFLNEIIQMGIDGVVFDLTDIYPQSGSNMVVGIQNTCFCTHCLESLEEEGYRDGPEPFIGDSNPFRLLLRRDDDGTAHIPLNTNWSATQLMRMSLARGFIKDDNDQARSDAELLLKYVSARATATAKSVRRLGQIARENEVITAVILGDKDLDMSTMCDMRTLHNLGAASEYWSPEVNRRYVLEQQVPVNVYLWNRATYSVNAFFETFEAADKILAMRGVEEFLGRLLARSKRLLGNTLAPGNVYTANLSDEFRGFVGIPLSSADHAGLVNQLSQRATGQILPPHVLEAFRISTPAGAG